MTSPQRKLRRAGRRGEQGFSMLQMLVVVVLMVVISVFAVSQIAQARDNMRLAGAVSELAMRMEKARLDSIRRHAAPGQLATLTFTGANTYTVLMDFDYTGTPITRTFTLPDGVTIWPTDNIPPPIDFNWRGRTDNDIRLTLRNGRGTTRVVELTRNGEISIDRAPFNAQTGNISNVDPGSGINTQIDPGNAPAGGGANSGGGSTNTGGGSTNTGGGSGNTNATGNTNSGNTTTSNTNSGGGTTTGNTNSGGTTTGNTNSGGTTTGGNTNSGGTTGGNTNSGGTTTGGTTQGTPAPTPTPLPYCGANDRPAGGTCVCAPGYAVDARTGKCKKK